MKRLIAVSLLIIALPFMASVNNNSSVAYAGRMISAARIAPAAHLTASMMMANAMDITPISKANLPKVEQSSLVS